MKYPIIIVLCWTLTSLSGCNEEELATSQETASFFKKKDDDDSSSSSDDHKCDDESSDVAEGPDPTPPPELNEETSNVTMVAAVKDKRSSYTSIALNGSDVLIVVNFKHLCAQVAIAALTSNKQLHFKTTLDPRVKTGFTQKIYDLRRGKQFSSCSIED